MESFELITRSGNSLEVIPIAPTQYQVLLWTPESGEVVVYISEEEKNKLGEFLLKGESNAEENSDSNL